VVAAVLHRGPVQLVRHPGVVQHVPHHVPSDAQRFAEEWKFWVLGVLALQAGIPFHNGISQTSTCEYDCNRGDRYHGEPGY
jgi:hypothetical protein